MKTTNALGAAHPTESSQSTGDRVVELIRDALLQGRFSPGQHISADGLAREMNISHIPVREALNKLSVEGHLFAVPNRGFFVPHMSLAEIEDVYHWRQVLEDEAHRIAMPELTPEDISRLESLVTTMHRATRKSDATQFQLTTRKFHFVIFERTGSARLIRMLDTLWDSAAHYQSVLLRDHPPTPSLDDDHDALLDAYRARDVHAGIAIMDKHRTSTLSLLRDILANG